MRKDVVIVVTNKFGDRFNLSERLCVDSSRFAYTRPLKVIVRNQKLNVLLKRLYPFQASVP